MLNYWKSAKFEKRELCLCFKKTLQRHFKIGMDFNQKQDACHEINGDSGVNKQ